MVKKYKNPEKSQKISKIPFFLAPKKMVSFLFSNIRRTQFDQSSPVQPVSEIQKSFKKKLKKSLKKKN